MVDRVLCVGGDGRKFRRRVSRPHFDCVVPAGGGESGAVGRTAQRGDAVLVRKHAPHLDALHRVPQVDQIIVVPAENHSAGHLNIIL